MRVKVSTTDPFWIGRNGPNTEGWRVLREEPVGTPNFVAPRPIDESQLSQLHLLYNHIPFPEYVHEWESILEDPVILVKGPPAFMKNPSYHWLNTDFLKVCWLFPVLLSIILLSPL